MRVKQFFPVNSEKDQKRCLARGNDRSYKQLMTLVDYQRTSGMTICPTFTEPLTLSLSTQSKGIKYRNPPAGNKHFPLLHSIRSDRTIQVIHILATNRL